MSKKTLRDRADDYFGAGNLAKMRAIPFGRDRMAFVGSNGKRLWIYQENGGASRTAIAVRLTDKMRDDLLDALEGF